MQYGRLLSRTRTSATGESSAELSSGGLVDTDIVTERVSQQARVGGVGVKANQAWKYPGNNIVRAPSTVLNGRYYTDPKADQAGSADEQGKLVTGNPAGVPRRKQESNFMITINNNVRYPSSDEADAKRAYKGALEMLSKQHVLLSCLKFGPKHAHYRNDQANPGDVILPGIGFTATVETGDVMKLMHAHIFLEVEHYSQIQINIPVMTRVFLNAFNETLGPGHRLRFFGKPYVHVDMQPQKRWNDLLMKQYLKKGMLADA